MKSVPKHFIILFICLFIIISNQFAQNPIVENLQNELKQNPQNDAKRVEVLHQLILEQFIEDFERTKALIIEADSLGKSLSIVSEKGDSLIFQGLLSLTESNYLDGLQSFQNAYGVYEASHDKIGIGSALSGIAAAYVYLDQDSMALLYFQRARLLNTRIKDKQNVAELLLRIGELQSKHGAYERAKSNYSKSGAISNELNNIEFEAYTFIKMGAIYEDLGDFPKTIEYFKKSKVLFDKLDSSKYEYNLFMGLGVVNFKMLNDEKALLNIKQALSISRKTNNLQGLGESLYGLGHVYIELGEYEEAKIALDEAMEISQRLESKEKISRCAIALGILHFEIEPKSESLKNFKLALVISKELDSQVGVCNALFSIAHYYLIQEEYQLAEKYVLESQKIAVQLNLLLHRKECADLLSMIYNDAGDYKKAFESHQQYKILEDSIFNQENIKKMAQLESEYKYQQELAEASNRELSLTKTVKSTSEDLIKSQRNSLIAIAGILLLSLISGGFIFSLKLKQVQAENKNIVNQQKLLRLQMTPHFIFNSLSVLQGFILDKKGEKSLDYLSRFSKLLRITLENSRHKTVSLVSELEAVKSYVALQNLDMNPPYEYVMQIDPVIENMNIEIPPMLIQPFIENIIEHAFLGQEKNKRIDVDLSFKEDLLICTVMDNGIGIEMKSKEHKRHKNSLATAITSERLQLLSTDFNGPGSISIVNRKTLGEQGTLVTLVIPYKLS